MKKFGIDIDGTVTCPSSILPFINRDFNLSLTLEDVKQYDLSVLVNISREEFAKWWEKVEPTVYKESPLAEGAKDVLLEWKKDHQLFFISARKQQLLDLTKSWFTNKGISYHHIELIGTHNKIATIKKHGLNIFFEDKHDNAVNIYNECKIPVILFNTPYNQDPVPDGVIRVNNWQEAKEWVHQWLNSNK